MKNDIDIIFSSDNSFISSPYPMYKTLKEQAPVHRTSSGIIVAFGHENVIRILKNPALGRADMFKLHQNHLSLSPAEKMRQNWLLLMDPPRHKKIKPILHKCLLQAMPTEKQLFQFSSKLVSQINLSQPFDFVETYAAPLPLMSIAYILGLDIDDVKIFREWSDTIAKVSEVTRTQSEINEVNCLMNEIYQYFEQILSKKLYKKKSFLDLMHQEQKSSPKLLSDEFIIHSAIHLLAAGNETTRDFLSKTMLTLLNHKDVYTTLRSELGNLEVAIEEFFRYEPPVQLGMRIALMETHIDTMPIYKGEKVIFLIGSANRDEMIFVEPDQLNILRTPNPHLSFSSGVHTCIGAKLARLEGRVALSHLLQLPELEINPEISSKWRPSLAMHGLKSLWLNSLVS